MKKQRSVIRIIIRLMQVQMVTVLLLVAVSSIRTLRISLERMDTVAENLLAVYSRQMEDRVESMEQLLSVIVYDNTDLELLTGDDGTESFYAAVRMQKTLENTVKINHSVQMAVIADAGNDICLDANNVQMSIESKEALRDLTMECARQELDKNLWEISQVGEEAYLYRMMRKDSRTAAVFLSVDRFLDVIPDTLKGQLGFAIADQNGIIQGYSGYPLFEETLGIPVSKLNTRGMLSNETQVTDGRFTLYSYEKYADLLSQTQAGELLLIGVVVLLLIFDIYVIRVLKRRLIEPMKGMTDVMEEIMDGKYDLRVDSYADNREFSFLSETFNRLMDEILHLRIQFYEKQLELADAEQKYIRLQIRPHFFLNALTTLASLSSQGKKQEVNAYVEALSKNIRYMFSSGLHTVAVKEEVWHVENYFEMQELRYPDSVFYNIEMPKETENWRIPQMILHTLVENEYKYAVKPEETLTILIRLSLTARDGEEVLLLEMEDDGQGYPQETLDLINGDVSRPNQDGTHVGLWSIRHLLELMYDRPHLFTVENVKPHGAMNRILVPKETVNERGREAAEESL